MSTFEGWLTDQGADCAELSYDPEKKRYLVILKRPLPKGVLVTPEDEDRYVMGGMRKHLLLPGMDDGKTAETSVGSAARGGNDQQS